MSSDGGSQGSGFTIGWGWLSGGLAIVALAALGALTIVAAKADADVLSTVALALAVLAFAAQLMVSLAQGISGASQIAQVERVNANTQATLASIRATADAVLSNQREHFSEVLQAALMRAVPDAVEAVDPSNEDAENSSESAKGLSTEILSRVNAELLLGTLAGAAPGGNIAGTAASPGAGAQSGSTPDFDVLSSYPSEEEGSVFCDILESLNAWEVRNLFRRADAARIRASKGRPLGTWVRLTSDRVGPTTQSLVNKGLLHVGELRDSADGNVRRAWVQLTPMGVQVGRLLVARGASPGWLIRRVREIADES